MSSFFVGVDEAGRGPLAGPVAVGIVCVPAQYDTVKQFPGLNDSKKLSPKQREVLYEQFLSIEKGGVIAHTVVFSSAEVIDRIGITRAVQEAMWRGIRIVAPRPNESHIFLDGLLTAPSEYQQETIIHGDALVPVISLASVMAKVARDRLMCRLAKKFPEYGFEQHKGYGTIMHREAISTFGVCRLHRQTFVHSRL